MGSSGNTLLIVGDAAMLGVDDGSVQAFSEPEDVAALPGWFLQGQGRHRLPDPHRRETSSNARRESHATRQRGG
jgi:hypothetical protein